MNASAVRSCRAGRAREQDHAGQPAGEQEQQREERHEHDRAGVADSASRSKPSPV